MGTAFRVRIGITGKDVFINRNSQSDIWEEIRESFPIAFKRKSVKDWVGEFDRALEVPKFDCNKPTIEY